MSDIVEIIARAICMADDSHEMGLWREFLPEANAALAALEEAGYSVVKKTAGITHEQERFEGEQHER